MAKPQGAESRFNRFYRVFFAVFCVFAASHFFPAASPAPIITSHITTRSGSQIALKLETATTPQARAHGLMQRKTLAPHDGMAFFFPRPAPQKFWMKNTLIPLDMLFIDAAGRIIYIGHGTPLSLDPVGTDMPIATVIEIDAGRAAREGIAVGDKVAYAVETSTYALAR